MKNGKLEDFIKENRMTFDQYMPDRQIWYRIENQMDKNDLRKLIIAWSTRIAAAFLVVLFCGIILGISIGNARQSQFDYASSPELKRYQETESYYQKEIGIKLNEVTDPQIKSNVEIDL
ncbi:MAG: hypothetical protein H7X99_02180, partial [Saprospiraceae bacterium]|nr:hypothetical protein [Saprospiraceae bacterium]